MGNRKSTVDGKSRNAGQPERRSATTKDTDSCQQVNTRMAQNVLLIWLDSNISDANEDCRNTVSQLRRVVHTINKFTDGEECIKFIASINNEKACMIISGSLGQHIVPQIHDKSLVDSIFIFCSEKNRHEQWTKSWSKIKGIFTEILPICDALKQAAQHCEHNAISISFVATGGDMSNKNLDQLDNSFMYTQILKEILLTIKFEQQHIQEFIDYCRDIFHDNIEELVNVKELKRKYRDKTPIWWYTKNAFLYPMLNRALRVMDVDTIIKMGFFIDDLHRQIEKLHKEQFSGHDTDEIFTVYRGQGISMIDFEQMTKSKGGLMSFNNFLSTSKNYNIAIPFAEDALDNPDSVGIVFVMSIDPSKSTTPFALINDVSYFQTEDEILFSMHTVFRIHDIKPIHENQRLFQVNLTLTSDNDKDLCTLTDRIRKETFPDEEGWYRLGQLLLKIGESEKAEEVYEDLVGQSKNKSGKGSVYNQIGWAKYNKGEYKEAIRFYEKSLKIKKKTLPVNHPDLATLYSNIGNVYYNMNEPQNALSSYEKALEIQQASLSSTHPKLAMSYNNIGNAYGKMGDHSKALSYYKKNLEINQKTLPPNHPDLAMSYNNIGSAHYDRDEYLQALLLHEKALEIKQKILRPNHPDLAMSFNNIGNVYFSMHDYSKALSSYERAVEIGQRSLPSNHPELQKWQKNLDKVKEKL
jgi:tetratricopeptide (TPR) repeat protein